LGANPFSEAAVRRIFEIKGRAETKPILVLVDSMDMLKQAAAVSEISDAAYALADRFWPGPLTLILPALSTVPRLVTAGSGSIGVRWPKAGFATRLARAFGGPITATSANKSGMPSTTGVAEVQAQLGRDLEMLIDGGTLAELQPSTVLDLTQPQPTIVREGPVSRTALTEALHGNIR
jgi:L-threonylcarbamoyladenylate synthase